MHLIRLVCSKNVVYYNLSKFNSPDGKNMIPKTFLKEPEKHFYFNQFKYNLL